MGRKFNNKMNAKQAADLPTPLRSLNADVKPADEPKTKKQQVTSFVMTGLVRALGVAMLIVSMGAYFQLVPLSLVFAGGYLGVQPGASINEMDTMIWIMTGAAIIVPMVWAFIKWVKYIWARFIINPISLFPSRSMK